MFSKFSDIFHHIFSYVSFLDWAVQNKHLNIVKLLLKEIEDIDVLSQNGFGRGCVTEAFQCEDSEIRKFLRIDFHAACNTG